MRTLILAAATVSAAVAMPAVAQETTASQETSSATSVTLSSGLDYSSGRYGMHQTTDILAALSDITLKTDDFQFSASLPYLDIKGPTSVIIGSNGVPVAIRRGVVPAPPSNRAGWGDLNLSATWSVPPEDLDEFQVDLTGRTKIARANAAKGLSSGETDFEFTADITREIGIWSPFVTFGYRIPGSPSAYSLNSAPSFSIGTSLQIDEKLLAIASYDFDGTISNTLADSQQFSASASWLFNDSLTFTVYASKGLSSGAPSGGTGLLIGWKMQ
jgi:Putative MetA-pathway of phenol degradation